MNTKIILAVLLILSLIVNGVFLLDYDNEVNTSSEIIVDDVEGYPKPQINIECTNYKDCYDKKDEIGIFCDWGHTIGCGLDSFCECVEITKG